jgi:hydrogenase nickel incorporation protein HypA/HybF
MHELSIALSILDTVSEEAERRGGVAVSAIHVRLGPLSGVVKESLLSAYDLAREESPFADARLVVEELPLVIYCDTCQAEQPVPSMQELCCPRCGTRSGRIIRGNELEITALEVVE